MLITVALVLLASAGPQELIRTDRAGAYRLVLRKDAETGAVRYAYGTDDAELARGPLSFDPLFAKVSSNGSGFAAVGVLEPVPGAQRSFVELVSGEGAVHRVEDQELCSWSDPLRNGLEWNGVSWIDEWCREWIVAVNYFNGAGPGRMCAAELATGRLREAGLDELGRGLLQGAVEALRVARHHDTNELAEWLLARGGEHLESPALRVRAATALALLGRNSGVQFLLEAHRAGGAELLATDAYPFLERAVRAGFASAYEAVGNLGETALPVCERLLEEPWTEGSVRAARLIGEHGTGMHLPLLLRTVRADRPDLAYSAVEAAYRIAGDDVHPELAHLLEQGLARDDALGVHFTHHRDPRVLPALKTALARHAAGTREHRTLLRAIERQEAAE